MKVVATIVGFLVLVGSVGAVVMMRPAPKSDAQKLEEYQADMPEVSDSGPQPALEVTPSRVHVFGEMKLGDEDSHTFNVKNVGEGVLKLKTKLVTCKCTLSDLEDTELDPGEEIPVTLTWTPKSAAEEFQQKAVIKTNVPGEEELELTVQGSVLFEVVVRPGDVWDVGTISEDEDKPTTYDAVIGSQLREDFEVLGVESESGAITAEMKPIPEELREEGGVKSGSMVQITVRPEVEVGRFSDQLVFKTNLESSPVVPITVLGTRAGPFSVLGPGWTGGKSRLNLQRFPAPQGKTQSLTMFVDRGDQPLELKNVRVTPDVLNVDLKHDPDFAGNREKYTLTVSVPPGVKPGIYESEDAVLVEADVDHPRFQKLNFTVNFRAEP